MAGASKFLEKIPSTPASIKQFVKKAVELEADDAILSYAFLYHVATLLAEKTELSADEELYLDMLVMFLEQEAARTECRREKVAAHIQEIGEYMLAQAEKVKSIGGYQNAALIFELYRSFDCGNDESAKKLKYCKWKAVELLRKLKSKEEPEQQPEQPPEQPPEQQPEKDTRPSFEKRQQIERGMSIEEECKAALSAIEYRDYDTAVAYLERTLKRLQEDRQK